ncbi:MAG: PAS domain-containing sensor histidine kinase, partial [Pseudomonadota bacterium]
MDAPGQGVRDNADAAPAGAAQDPALDPQDGAASAQQLNAVFDSLRTIYVDYPDAAIIADHLRRIVWVNPMAEAMFGYRIEDLLGHQTAILYADPEDFVETGQVRYNAAPTAARSHYEVAYKRRSGEVFLSETTGGPLRSDDGRVIGFLGIIRDISATRDFDATLSSLYALSWDQKLSTPEKMTGVLDLGRRYFGLDNGAIVLIEDEQAVVRYVRMENGGLKADDRLPLSGSIAGIIHESLDIVCCSARAADGVDFSRVSPFVKGRLAEGDVASWIGATLDVDGEPHGAVYFWSSTLRRPFLRVERDMGGIIAPWIGHKISRENAMNRLQAAHRAAEAATRAKSEFLAALSHDVRTPLTGLIGMLDLIGLEPRSDERQMMVQYARGAATSLFSLLSNSLELIQSGHANQVIRNDEVALITLAEEALAPFAPSALQRSLILDASVAAGLPERIVTDHARMRQILHNLVSNACKYTKRGEVRLAIDRAERAGFLSISVNDTGIGIDAADQARIFEPFEQAHGENEREETGTGIGLALCHRLVQALGGTIGLASTPGEGSRFWIEIPCRPASSNGEEAKGGGGSRSRSGCPRPACWPSRWCRPAPVPGGDRVRG